MTWKPDDRDFILVVMRDDLVLSWTDSLPWRLYQKPDGRWTYTNVVKLTPAPNTPVLPLQYNKTSLYDGEELVGKTNSTKYTEKSLNLKWYAPAGTWNLTAILQKPNIDNTNTLTDTLAIYEELNEAKGNE